MSQTHKYPINYQFKISKNDKIYKGTIIKYVQIVRRRFHFAENNLAEFDVNNIPPATYNFIESIDTNTNQLNIIML